MDRPPSTWDIDRALEERNFAFLSELIRRQDLSADVRAHLASVVGDLLSKKIKFPRHRQKSASTYFNALEIGNCVHQLKWQGVKKPIAVAAAEFKCSVSKVEKICAIHKKALEHYRREKYEHDFLMEMAYEARAEAALEYLKEERGDREYTDEEIEAAAKYLDDERAYDDY